MIILKVLNLFPTYDFLIEYYRYPIKFLIKYYRYLIEFLIEYLYFFFFFFLSITLVIFRRNYDQWYV